jgi:UDP-N-acetylglucosamine 2-epimerase (non-hydrolysing)
VLATFHRAENVDIPERLRAIVDGLRLTAKRLAMPVVCSVHPRTRLRLQQYYLEPSDKNLLLLEPLGFFDFVALERDARVVVTDSGTVQEECCILGVPGVTIRDTTERPETVECGSNALAGVDTEALVRLVEAGSASRGWWTVPREYLETRVTGTVVNIVLGFHNRSITPSWPRTSQRAAGTAGQTAPATGEGVENGRLPAGTRPETDTTAPR